MKSSIHMLSLVKQKLSKEFFMSTGKAIKSDVKDLKLAALGKKRIMWADTDMPVLARVSSIGFFRTATV